MGQSKDSTKSTACASPSATATAPTTTMHNTPALPVRIPKSRQEMAHPPRHGHGRRHSMHPRDGRPPQHAIPPSIHALLAVTTIPRPKNPRAAGNRERRRQQEKDAELTLEAVVESQQEIPEKRPSHALSKTTLDLLLSAPEELEVDDDDFDDDSTTCSDSIFGSVPSTRTASVESAPSLKSRSTSPLGTRLSTANSPSATSRPPLRRRRTSSLFTLRRSLEPVSPLGGDPVAHPLSAEVTIDELDFRVFNPPADLNASVWDSAFARLPLKSAFKSNLTASLRAIRSAAKSFSALSLASIPPDDFLTRSIIAIDPRVPYTDERRPPVLEEEPSAELRRYLNPPTRPRAEDGGAAGRHASPVRQFTASIPMQTYKIERLRENARASRLPVPVTPRTRPSTQGVGSGQQAPPAALPPAVRQREMRENSDFIRIAVLEMAMRRKGKLDDQRPGRARWALPPRKAVTGAYEVGEDGVPVRWLAVTF